MMPLPRIARLSALLLLPLSLGQSECPEESADDLDLDGFTVEQGDCDDFDPYTFPGAAEICDDDRDQDCSGLPLISLARVQTEVFDPTCVACHNETNQGGLNLEAAVSWGNLVDVPAGDVPEMARISPFDPEASYLLHKLWGTHLEVGGEGEAMPKGEVEATATQVDLVEWWVLGGALQTCP